MPVLGLIAQPDDAFRLGDYLNAHFRQPEWMEFRAAVAFVQQSGVRHISEALAEFARRATVKVSVGIDLGGTSEEGLSGLLEALGGRGGVWIFDNENNSTFHPKVYLFKGHGRADLVVGSGNLTEGGLFTNYEAALQVSLDLALKADGELLAQVEAALDKWSDPSQGTALPLTPELIRQLVRNGDVPTEAQAREIREKIRRAGRPKDLGERKPLFRSVPVRKAPPAPGKAKGAVEGGAVATRPANNSQMSLLPAGAARLVEGDHRGFLMVLRNTDVGVGQKTAGKSKRSPEIFIPVEVIRPVKTRKEQVCDPDFWGWPRLFADDPARPGKKDRHLRLRFGDDAIEATLWYNDEKKDFRLRNNTLRSSGGVGDIIRVERAEPGHGDDYSVMILRRGTPEHVDALKLCVHRPRSSPEKRWGYY